jgi:hypothetical protein
MKSHPGRDGFSFAAVRSEESAQWHFLEESKRLLASLEPAKKIATTCTVHVMKDFLSPAQTFLVFYVKNNSLIYS